ncbi:MAG: hypothetical protein AAGM04_14075 [Pseudomonadota bacterium]
MVRRFGLEWLVLVVLSVLGGETVAMPIKTADGDTVNMTKTKAGASRSKAL